MNMGAKEGRSLLKNDEASFGKKGKVFFTKRTGIKESRGFRELSEVTQYSTNAACRIEVQTR